jgi:hypothetical protein
MPYSYTEQHLVQARNALASQGDKATVMGQALRHCVLGFVDLDRTKLDGDTQACVRYLDYIVENAGLDHADPVETWIAKAGSFEQEDFSRLSEVIEELHDWFIVQRSGLAPGT